METIITHENQEMELDYVASYMDREICEEMHPCDLTAQEFYEEYCQRYEAKFGEEFVIN